MAFKDGPAAVFWDAENVRLPGGHRADIVYESIMTALQCHGHFKDGIQIFGDLQPQRRLYSELLELGCSLRDIPPNGKENRADNVILVEMMAFAIDHPAPACLVLISSDSDFCYGLSRLRARGYRVVLICSRNAKLSIKAAADVVLDWERDVLHLSDSEEVDPSLDALPVVQPITDNEEQASTSQPRRQEEKRDGEDDIHNDTSFTTASEPTGNTMEVARGIGHFQDLIDVLQTLERFKGSSQFLRSDVGSALAALESRRRDQKDAESASSAPARYTKTSNKCFLRYTTEAALRGIIRMGDGGQLGSEWIRLRAAFRAPSRRVEKSQVLLATVPAAQSSVKVNTTSVRS